MRDFAIVKSIEGQRIEVVSLVSDACVRCNSIDCAKQGKSFHVINKRNLPLSENTIIRIGFPRILNGFLGLISLLIPIFASVFGYFFSSSILSYFELAHTQSLRACVVGMFFVASSLIIFIISRTDIHLTHPEVLQIM
ncbi:MAG: SoxR reducing system RseC family protein [Treponema sp.]|nr:SoxR reducing system RseC family protein [Treponema sp.]